MATTATDACGCDASSVRIGTSGLTGRVSRPDPGNYWPDHNMDPPTDFINERNRTAVMWRL